jgi:hypothetical protein
VLATLAFAWRGPLWWLGPLGGLGALLLLRFTLRLSVLEPEPLGGPDPTGLERRYALFRRKRVRGMYWLMVVLALVLTGGGRVALGGSILGAVIGLWGALFGTWADAQRYLLRRQLSGAEPPA